jgi:RNA polymerase sigma-70 factor (ECF subfamily)
MPPPGPTPTDDDAAEGRDVEDRDAEERVVTWWRDHAHRVQAYALRHVDAHTAQEVVSETFLVAWRRSTQVPDDVLPWLIGVARHVIHHHHRTEGRALALEVRLGRLARRQVSPGADVTLTEREHVVLALAQLSEKDREALLLVAWDGLSRERAAAAAGCRVGTFDVRLSRARRRLGRLLDDPDPAPVTRKSAPSFPAPTGGSR